MMFELLKVASIALARANCTASGVMFSADVIPRAAQYCARLSTNAERTNGASPFSSAQYVSRLADSSALCTSIPVLSDSHLASAPSLK